MATSNPTPIPDPLDDEDDGPLPPPSPRALARVDAWLAELTPEERAIVEKLRHHDGLDGIHDE
jgi:hypothetical protein